VRKLFTICLLAVVTCLVAADPLLCPDGCTDAQHAGQPSHPGACLSCQNGIVSTDSIEPVSAPSLIESRPIAPEGSLPSSPSHAIDHPPRLSA